MMGSRPDGWWRDRAGAAVRLHGELARLAASGRAVLPGGTGPADDAEWVLVLEGAAKAAAARIGAPADQAVDQAADKAADTDRRSRARARGARVGR